MIPIALFFRVCYREYRRVCFFVAVSRSLSCCVPASSRGLSSPSLRFVMTVATSSAKRNSQVFMGFLIAHRLTVLISSSWMEETIRSRFVNSLVPGQTGYVGNKVSTILAMTVSIHWIHKLRIRWFCLTFEYMPYSLALSLNPSSIESII